MTTKVSLHETTEAQGSALWAKGFRPFFILAALCALWSVPVWVLSHQKLVGYHADAYFKGYNWHAHEMIFGYTVAIIAGFLLTAVANWTKRETVIGRPLMGLALVWLLGRIVMALAPALPGALVAVVDLAFLPLLAIGIGKALIASRNKRNYSVLVITLVLFALNLLMHLDALGVAFFAAAARKASIVSVDIVILLIVFIAGRIVPLFTRNATKVMEIRKIAWLDWTTTLGMALLAALDLTLGSGHIAAKAVAGLVGVAALLRMRHWGTQHTWHEPLLWILHVAYLWVPIGLFMRALPVPAYLATHALTVGAIGGLTLGMLVRVSLGHTGRKLQASRWMGLAFWLINLGAIGRTLLPLAAPGSWYYDLLLVTGGLWFVAFALYLVAFFPVLLAPRPDGRPG